VVGNEPGVRSRNEPDVAIGARAVVDLVDVVARCVNLGGVDALAPEEGRVTQGGMKAADARKEVCEAKGGRAHLS